MHQKRPIFSGLNFGREIHELRTALALSFHLDFAALRCWGMVGGNIMNKQKTLALCALFSLSVSTQSMAQGVSGDGTARSRSTSWSTGLTARAKP
jgi:hypothetical protein